MGMLEDFTLMDGIGVLGSLMICSAYAGVSFGAANPKRAPFHLLNLAGSLLLLLSLYFRPNPGAILIEVLWAAIAITALVRLAAGRR